MSEKSIKQRIKGLQDVIWKELKDRVELFRSGPHKATLDARTKSLANRFNKLQDIRRGYINEADALTQCANKISLLQARVAHEIIRLTTEQPMGKFRFENMPEIDYRRLELLLRNSGRLSKIKTETLSALKSNPYKGHLNLIDTFNN